MRDKIYFYMCSHLHKETILLKSIDKNKSEEDFLIYILLVF